MSETRTLITIDILEARIVKVQELIAQVDDAWLLKELQGMRRMQQFSLKELKNDHAPLKKFILLLKNHKVQRVQHRYEYDDYYWYIDDKQVYKELECDEKWRWLFDVNIAVNFDYYVEKVDSTKEGYVHNVTEYRLRELSKERLSVQ